MKITSVKWMKKCFLGLSACVVIGGGAAFVVSSPAKAYGYFPQCGLGFSSDSYGRGVEEVFFGENHRPQLNDEGCYRLGMDSARQALSSHLTDPSACRRDFADGRKQGLIASSQSGGTTCYVVGYQAGRADLDIGAREGDTSVVGSECVRNYRKGVSDSRAGLIATQPDFEPKQSTCYSAGYYDGPYVAE